MTTHTAWCARGHSCALDEHRAEPIIVKVPAQGHAVVTRVAAPSGREYVEIRLRVALPGGEPLARLRMRSLLSRLPGLIAGPDGGRCTRCRCSPRSIDRTLVA
jgi:hypothetical protein